MTNSQVIDQFAALLHELVDSPVSVSDSDVSTSGFFQSSPFVEALQNSNLTFAERVLYRVAYLRPKNRVLVDEYIAALVQDTGKTISTMANGDLIRFLIENMDEIIKFINLLIGLFG